MVRFENYGDNKTMTQTGWSEDFSYTFYENMLNVMKARYTIRQFYEVAELNYKQRIETDLNVFLRHDIDVSVHKALELAQHEYDNEVCSTYFVRMNTKYYDIKDEPTLDQLMEIKSLGHEIGLHYDSRNDKNIMDEIKKLDELIDDHILSISFHIPTKDQMDMGLNYCGRVNAYAKELRVRYKSDSSGVWRDGNPMDDLKTDNKPIQLAIHPIWWGYKTIPESKTKSIVTNLNNGW